MIAQQWVMHAPLEYLVIAAGRWVANFYLQQNLCCSHVFERMHALQDYALGQVEQNSKLRARQLCNALQSLGPSFVKIGQALSSRPDLLPQIYLEVQYPLSVGNLHVTVCIILDFRGSLFYINPKS